MLACPALARAQVAAEPGPADSLLAFPPPRVRAWQVGLVRADRLEHASLSFTLATALTLLTRDRTAAAGATFALGLGKELWDRRGPSGFDATDLAADAAGITLAIACVRPHAP